MIQDLNTQRGQDNVNKDRLCNWDSQETVT